jgi:hypothetical protein
MFEDYHTPPLLEHHETAILDSGCTGPFLLINAPCHNKIRSQYPLRVRLPNGETMDLTHSSLDIPELSEAAYVVHVFADMANHYLISVGQMCNEGCERVIMSLSGLTGSQFTIPQARTL